MLVASRSTKIVGSCKDFDKALITSQLNKILLVVLFNYKTTDSQGIDKLTGRNRGKWCKRMVKEGFVK